MISPTIMTSQISISLTTQTPRSMTHIPFMPLELVDLILDYAHSNPSTLAACSLVCKSWFPSARFHIFSSVNLNADSACAFSSILNSTSSTIAHFINRVDVKDTCESARWLPAVFPSLDRLPSLTAISITSSFDTPFSHAVLYTLSSFTNLVELKLVDCSFDDFSDVQELLCAFPALETLHIEADWVEPSSIEPTADSPSLRLKELFLRCEAAHVLEWFLIQPDVAPVSKLTLHGIDAFELPVVTNYLQALGPALTHLTIFPSGSLYDSLCGHVNLSLNPCLQYLKLVIDCDSANMLMAHDLLAQVTSPVFEEVELSFYSIRQNPKTADLWASLDALLAQRRFSSVKRATMSAMTAASTAKATLPLCHSRGILRVHQQ